MISLYSLLRTSKELKQDAIESTCIMTPVCNSKIRCERRHVHLMLVAWLGRYHVIQGLGFRDVTTIRIENVR